LPARRKFATSRPLSREVMLIASSEVKAMTDSYGGLDQPARGATP
jgi:hypothetical protein